MNKLKLYEYISLFDNKTPYHEIKSEAFERVENKKEILDWAGEFEVVATKLGPAHHDSLILYSVVIYGV